MEDQVNLCRRQRHLNGLLKTFWSLWKKEYLVALREIDKCSRKKGADNINVDDIVIIHDERQPKQFWKLGRVDELINGIDGVVGAAKLKTGRSSGLITRPLNKLYPLETVGNSKRVPCQEATNNTNNIDIRPKRDAAIRCDLKMKFGDDGVTP